MHQKWTTVTTPGQLLSTHKPQVRFP